MTTSGLYYFPKTTKLNSYEGENNGYFLPFARK